MTDKPERPRRNPRAHPDQELPDSESESPESTESTGSESTESTKPTEPAEPTESPDRGRKPS